MSSRLLVRVFGGGAGRRRAARPSAAAEAVLDTPKAMARRAVRKHYMPADKTGVLWLDNLYPLRVHRFDVRHWFIRSDPAVIDRIVNYGEGVVSKIVPRPREGGAFVYFAAKDTSASSVAQAIVKHLSQAGERSFFGAPTIRAHLVHGRPYMDDVLTRFPSRQIRVRFSGGDAPGEEALFANLRPFGKIQAMEAAGNEMLVTFKQYHGAVGARNCLHGFAVDGARLSIDYVAMIKPGLVSGFFARHPRVAVPLAAGMLAASTYLVVDPLRVFSITSKATHRFSLEGWPILGRLSQYSFDFRRLLRNRGDDDVETNQWLLSEGSTVCLDRIRDTLTQPPDSVLFLTGAKGTGKSALARQAVSSLDGKYPVIHIDCSHGNWGRDAHETLAASVGLFPPLWISSWMTMLTDAAIGGLGGSGGKGGDAASSIAKVLDCLALALTQMRHKDASVYPVVVIDGVKLLGARSREVLDQLVDWAYLVVDAEVAHVLFVSDTAFADRYQDEDHRKVEVVRVVDASEADAVRYVDSSLARPVTDATEREAIKVLGGRLADLQALVLRVRGGLSVGEAVDKVVERAAVTLRTLGLGDGRDQDTVKWSRVQFWHLMTQLATGEAVLYDAVAASPFFKGDNGAAINAMARTDLVTVVNPGPGRPREIRVGRPVLKAAFARLQQDATLSAAMEAEVCAFRIEQERAKQEKYQTELARLEGLTSEGYLWSSLPTELAVRRRYLLQLARASQVVVEAMEKDRKRMMGRLK